MRAMHRAVARLSLAVCLGAFVLAGAMQFASGALPWRKAPSASSLLPTSDWPSYGGTLRGDRANALDTSILPATAPSLDVAWRYQAGGAITSTPAVVGDRVYAATWKGGVFALNASTGAPLWQATLPTGRVDSSPAVGDGLVFLGDATGHLYALRAEDGSIAWSAILDDRFEAPHVWGSPVVAEDVVYVGLSSDQDMGDYHGPPTARGSVSAFAARTGERLWRTDTVPAGASGGDVTSTPAIDLATRRLYVGTGNAIAGPAAETTDAILALDLDTGDITWSAQFGANDTCAGARCDGPDADFLASPNLFTLGNALVVGEAKKDGTYHVVNASTGAIVWESGTPSRISDEIFGTTAVASGVIVEPFNSAQKLQAIAADDGRALWQANLPTGFLAPVSIAGTVAIVGDEMGVLRAYDIMTGAPLLARPLAAGPIFGGAAIADGRVFVGSVGAGYTATDGQIVALGIR